MLQHIDGFQDCQNVPKPEWVRQAIFGNQPGRDGSTNGAAGNPNGINYLPFTLADSTLIHGFGFYLQTSNPIGTTVTIHSYYSGAATPLIHMGVTAGGMLEFRRGTNFATGTTVGTTSGHDPFSVQVWRHIQIKYVAHVSSGTLVVKVDGVTVLNLTGVQTSSTTATPDRWYINTTNNFSGNLWFYDDSYICDGTDGTSTQGRANNDFLGDLAVKTLIPSANGTNTAWTKSTGTNGAALVDEVPPNTTDYISSTTSGQKETMALPDLPATTSTVFGLRLHLYAAKTDAGIASIKPAIRESGGTYTAQTAKPLSTTYQAYAGDIIASKPSSPGTAFSAADVNGLEAGVELA